ncbi:hypothetical protein [Leifsonia sp. NPDC080035]|uniref:Uncharacterized protein n=1 Tax=Leifsonia sp. NPDC080035 TaxID=3143936 RepID=A0AAU7GBS1_9MICO
MLTAEHSTAAARLARREIGGGFEVALGRSAAAADALAAQAPPSVHRIPTDGRTVREIAEELVALSGWATPSGG